MANLILAGLLDSMLDLCKQLGVSWQVILIHFGILSTLFFILKSRLWGPVQKQMHDREEDIKSAEREIKVRREEVERIAESYEAKMAEIEAQAYEKVQAAINRGIEEKNRIIAEAQAEAEKKVLEAREQIRLEKREALDSLKRDIASMSTELVTRISSGSLSVDEAKASELVTQLVDANGEGG
jgi:F-type H+-transporting ATPase subunit b